MSTRHDNQTTDIDQADLERRLLGRVARRDRAAFSELYKAYQPRLLGYLIRLLPSFAVAEEVLDDVMFVVWCDAAKFRGASSVSSWIFGIAYNRAISALRKEQRHRRSIDGSVDVEAVATSPAREPELLDKALARLSRDHLQVIVLTYFCGFSYQEIAEIADCPVNTVKTRMFHARRRLKLLLPGDGGPGKEQDCEEA